jgi:hypothetical protein
MVYGCGRRWSPFQVLSPFEPAGTASHQLFRQGSFVAAKRRIIRDFEVGFALQGRQSNLPPRWTNLSRGSGDPGDIYK